MEYDTDDGIVGHGDDSSEQEREGYKLLTVIGHFGVLLHLSLRLCDVDVQYFVFFTGYSVARALEFHFLTQPIQKNNEHTYINEKGENARQKMSFL